MKGLNQFVEARIQGAIARGELDGLPGQGKPLKVDDLAGFSKEERIEALLRRAVGGPPEEVTLLREIAELREQFQAAQSDVEKEQLRKAIQEKSTRLSILFEATGRSILVNRALDFMP